LADQENGVLRGGKKRWRPASTKKKGKKLSRREQPAVSHLHRTERERGRMTNIRGTGKEKGSSRKGKEPSSNNRIAQQDRDTRPSTRVRVRELQNSEVGPGGPECNKWEAFGAPGREGGKRSLEDSSNGTYDSGKSGSRGPVLCRSGDGGFQESVRRKKKPGGSSKEVLCWPGRRRKASRGCAGLLAEEGLPAGSRNLPCEKCKKKPQ